MREQKFVSFREKSYVIKDIDIHCEAQGINRSDFIRLSLRKTLVEIQQSDAPKYIAKREAT